MSKRRGQKKSKLLDLLTVWGLTAILQILLMFTKVRFSFVGRGFHVFPYIILAIICCVNGKMNIFSKLIAVSIVLIGLGESLIGLWEDASKFYPLIPALLSHMLTGFIYLRVWTPKNSKLGFAAAFITINLFYNIISISQPAIIPPELEIYGFALAFPIFFSMSSLPLWRKTYTIDKLCFASCFGQMAIIVLVQYVRFFTSEGENRTVWGSVITSILINISQLMLSFLPVFRWRPPLPKEKSKKKKPGHSHNSKKKQSRDSKAKKKKAA